MRTSTMSLVFGAMTLNERSTHIEGACNDLCEDIEGRGYEVVNLHVHTHKSATGEREGGFSYAPEIIEDGVVIVAAYRKSEPKLTLSQLKASLEATPAIKKAPSK